MTANELCMRLKSGGGQQDTSNVLDKALKHILEDRDPLVAWAWKPGPGREPPPGKVEEFVQILKWWKKGGAACPPPGGR